MKIVLVALIFACFLPVISAFLWFNSYENQPTKAPTTSSTTRRPITPLQQQSANQQKDQLRYRTFIFRRIPVATRKINSIQNSRGNATTIRQGISGKTSPIIVRDRFHAISYRTQQRQTPLRNRTFLVQRPVNQTLNNPPKRVIYQRFPSRATTRKVSTGMITVPNRRLSQAPLASTSKKALANVPIYHRFPARIPFISTSKKILANAPINHRSSAHIPLASTSKKTLANVPIYHRLPAHAPIISTSKKSSAIVPINRQQSSLGKVNTSSPKASPLRSLTTAAVRINAFENRQRLFDHYNRDEHWRAVYQRWNQRTTAHIPFKINSALQRRKRQESVDDSPQNETPSMIFSRHETFNEET